MFCGAREEKLTIIGRVRAYLHGSTMWLRTSTSCPTVWLADEKLAAVPSLISSVLTSGQATLPHVRSVPGPPSLANIVPRMSSVRASLIMYATNALPAIKPTSCDTCAHHKYRSHNVTTTADSVYSVYELLLCYPFDSLGVPCVLIRVVRRLS